MAEEPDDDVKAITTLISVLKPLEPQARVHILEFVFKRLGIALPVPAQPTPAAPSPIGSPVLPSTPPSPPPLSGTLIDIRAFADEKNPKTVNEKVAVVAYYLAHLAPATERRDQITADDIRPYFIQAGFELPSSSGSMTLTNAKNAGYLNALERGQYRLNAVGHNLVAHKLRVTDDGKRKSTRTAASRKGPRKKPRSKSRR